MDKKVVGLFDSILNSFNKHPNTYEVGSRVKVNETNIRYANRVGIVVSLGVHNQNDLDEYKIAFVENNRKEWFYAHEIEPANDVIQ